MIKNVEIQILPEVAANQHLLKETLSKKYNIKEEDIKYLEIKKRSIDARQKKVKINLKIAIYINQIFHHQKKTSQHYKDVKNKEEVIIIGAGPAGLFAALKLITASI